jgi:3-deoxy-D-manno-octulosonate 8-phosphate phosphatase (KDO 8-P phosphatase)
MNALALLKNVKLFVFDVDGVLTDGSLILLDNGEMARQMNIKDGYALQLAIKHGYEILIISGGSSNAVKVRLQKLGIQHILLGVIDKKELLLNFISTNNFKREEVLYMGDDVPDFLPMQEAGVACAPADAVAEIKSIAHYISPALGGKGCVRDVIEKVLKLNGHWKEPNTVTSI